MTDLYQLLADRAAATPDSPAVRADGDTHDHRALQLAADAVAARLNARGVRPGDRVLLHGANSFALAAAVYGCARVGAAFVPLHPGTRPASLAHIVRDCAPVLALADQAVAHAHREAGVPALLLAGSADPHSAPPPRPAPDPDRPAALIYTSGSTGAPKAVVCPAPPMLFATRAIAERLGYQADDTVFSPLPFSFDYGLYQLLLSTLAGACLALPTPAESGTRMLGALTAARATVLPLVPSIATALVRLVERVGVAPVGLRLVTSTGAAFPEPLADAVRRSLPGARLALMYGLTECKRVSILTPDELDAKPGSVGRPLPGTSCAVLGPDGRELPVGAEGQLVVRGPHLMAGYWQAAELTDARYPAARGERELHTGDYGRIDADGYLYLRGREDDIYKQNGFRVGAIEVERAALDVPGVHAAAVVLATDRQSACLFAVADTSRAELLHALGDRLEQYKMPPVVRLVDALPLTLHGKVDRAELTRWVEGEA